MVTTSTTSYINESNSIMERVRQQLLPDPRSYYALQIVAAAYALGNPDLLDGITEDQVDQGIEMELSPLDFITFFCHTPIS
jgi:hypothetical protein